MTSRARSGGARRAWAAVALACGLTAPLLALDAGRSVAHGDPAAPGHGSGASTAAVPLPSDDLRTWLDYKARTQQLARPVEARLFYRRGLVARDSGAVDQAIHLVRGATQLDPHFVAPHLTLIGWLVTQDPALALSEATTLIEVARASFVFQLSLAANAFDILVRALFIAMLAAGILIVLLRNAQLRHPWEEALKRHVSPFGARVWPWALMALPYLLGIGLVLPTLLLLTMLWPVMRARERAFVFLWAALLCALPPASIMLKRFAHPLDVEQGPLYGIHTLHQQPPSADLLHRLEGLGAREPDNPYVQFGLGWMARQSGDLATAEAAYGRALKSWPEHDRVLNNLGNVLALQGRDDEAVALYRRAVKANPNSAHAYLNLSQIHTKHFDFRAASEAISHAWALDFELIQSAQSRPNAAGLLPFADQWLAPETFWLAVTAPGASSNGADALPPAWRNRIEVFPAFGLAVVLVAVAGIAIGIYQERRLPLLACSNCGRVVCRRCGERRRASAYCKSCAEAVCEARAYEFARALLARHREFVHRRGRLVRTAFASLVPGFGLLSLNRVGTPLVMLTAAALLALAQVGDPTVFVYEPQIGSHDENVRQGLLVGWGLLYAWSLGGYFLARSKRDAAERARTSPPKPRRKRADDAPAEAAA